jgi:hypothetical protein
MTLSGLEVLGKTFNCSLGDFFELCVHCLGITI